MEQKFDGRTPTAELTLAGRKVSRSAITNDWGLQVRWVVRRDGNDVATAPARTETTFQPDTAKPGKYEVVLQMFQYVDYKKTPAGEYANSKFIDISNVVTFTV